MMMMMMIMLTMLWLCWVLCAVCSARSWQWHVAVCARRTRQHCRQVSRSSICSFTAIDSGLRCKATRAMQVQCTNFLVETNLPQKTCRLICSSCNKTLRVTVVCIARGYLLTHSLTHCCANVQNSWRFRTTSVFNREYLRNGWRYPKSEN